MRSSLELLLILLVQDGIATPYELKTRADLSLGSTVPALTRLKKAGLLAVSNKGARSSRRFQPTPKGIRTLHSDWSAHLHGVSTDMESILRIAFLTWRLGSADKAGSFLRASARRLHVLATMAKAETTRFDRRAEDVDTEAIRWLRSRVEARRWESESKELELLADEMTQSPGFPKFRRDASKKK